MSKAAELILRYHKMGLEGMVGAAYAEGMGDVQAQMFATMKSNPGEWRTFLDEIESGKYRLDPWFNIDSAHGRTFQRILRAERADQ